MVEVLETYQWVIDALRGERPTATGAPVSIAGYSDTPATLLLAHSIQAMAAAIFGDQASLERHTAEAVPLVSASPTEYPGAVARALRGLALAGQIRATDGAARDTLLSELDEVTRWLADRAADAPQNFLHLLRLLEAERAWAVGDFQGCVRGFDAALHGAGQCPRPWHRALITERAARFYLAHGIDHNGYDLLTQARQQYAAWGATAKVAQLDWAYPSLPPHSDTAAAQRNTRSPDDSLGSGSVSTGTIDLLGILSTSQALSSETSIAGLHARVAQVLGAMTGATDVALLVWNDEHRHWLLPATGRVGGASTSDTAPMSVLRYLERTREPLVVPDATSDDRFARDPYFADADCCSLLAVPILSRGDAAGAVAAGEPADAGGVYRRAARRRQPDRRSARRVAGQRPAVCPSLPRPARGSLPPPIRPASASSATCTTAPSSGWCRWRWSFGWRRRRCRRRRASFGCDSTAPSSRQAAHLRSCAICRAAFTRRS